MNYYSLKHGNSKTAYLLIRNGALSEINSEVERMTVPMKFRRVNGTTNLPWMTAEIRRAINVKKTNYKSMKETATIETRERYQRSLRAC